MSKVSKRDILTMLAALGATAIAPAAAQSQALSLDLGAGREIGAAYLAANPGGDIDMLRRSRLPNGFSEAALPELRQRVVEDFRHGRVFVYRGWRLAETEAQLFALLTRD